MITGSAAGVYDDLAWIAPLERFVRAAYETRFQWRNLLWPSIDGPALGGTARKSEKGWGIGRHVYDVAPGNGVIGGETIAIAASHQDQVIEPPAGATTLFHSEFTPHAGLLYANGTAMSVQPHPEFTVPFAHFCCDKAGLNNAPEALVATAKASLEQPLDNADLGARSRALKATKRVTSACRAKEQDLGPIASERLVHKAQRARRKQSWGRKERWIARAKFSQ